MPTGKTKKRYGLLQQMKKNPMQDDDCRFTDELLYEKKKHQTKKTTNQALSKYALSSLSSQAGPGMSLPSSRLSSHASRLDFTSLRFVSMNKEPQAVGLTKASASKPVTAFNALEAGHDLVRRTQQNTNRWL